MRKPLIMTVMAGLLAVFSTSTLASDPDADLEAYRDYFKKRFPDLSAEDLTRGAYNFNEDKRKQWEDIMEFPPYEIAIEEGKALYEKPFENGKTYAGCLPQGGIGIAHTYPRFDKASGKVRTLEIEINDCRQKNGEKPLKLLKGSMPKILAYLADTSRGKTINIEVPDDPRALAAYEDGKRIYFTRRGPRGFACYNCHWESAGARIRGNVLSPAVGQGANFPAYRSKWGAIGPMQRRYKGCMRNTGAKPLKEGSEGMNNLQYFHTRMSNGLPWTAPATRM